MDIDKYKSLFTKLDNSFNSTIVENWIKEFGIDKNNLDKEFNCYALYIANSFLKNEIDYWQADESLWSMMMLMDYKLPKLYWEIAIKFEDFEIDDNPDKNIVDSLKDLLEELEKAGMG